MINEFNLRTAGLIGEENTEKIKNSTVAVFGIGGVGSYAAEALARSGVGHLYLCDSDSVEKSNLNRQLIATYDTVGQPKTSVAAARFKSINPDIKITEDIRLILNGSPLPFEDFDFIIDAVDNVTAKLYLITEAQKRGIPIISVMGTGNKLCPEKLRIDDIYSTSMCPLCRVMRLELKKRGIKKLPVVWSDETPITRGSADKKSSGRPAPASMAFVPGCAGLCAASYVIRKLVNL